MNPNSTWRSLGREIRLYLFEWLLGIGLRLVPRNTWQAQAFAEFGRQYTERTIKEMNTGKMRRPHEPS